MKRDLKRLTSLSAYYRGPPRQQKGVIGLPVHQLLPREFLMLQPLPWRRRVSQCVPQREEHERPPMIRLVMMSARRLTCLSSRHLLLAGVQHLAHLRMWRAPWACLRHQIFFYRLLPGHRPLRRLRLSRLQSPRVQLSTDRFLPVSRLSTQPLRHVRRRRRITGPSKSARRTRRQKFPPVNHLRSIRLLNYVPQVRSHLA